MAEEIPRPRETVKLPCGILYDEDLFTEVVIQEMRDTEERILGSKNPDMKRIVANCLVQVGSCADKHIFNTDIIPNMRIGDYNAIAFALRILSLGPEYKYQIQCVNEECNIVSSYEVDLSDIGTIHMLEPEGNEYDYTLRCGSTATFRPVLHADTKMLQQIEKEKEDVLGRSLAVRLVRIDSEEPEGKTEKSKLNSATKLLKKYAPAYGEREKIRIWLRETETREDVDGEEIRYGRDGRMDTIVQDSCEECGATWKHIMSIDAGFLLPSSEV